MARARISADAVLHHIRWITPVNADGDLFSINNNAAALFARCYISERPNTRDNFELRKSFLDALKPDEKWKLVLTARSGLEPEQPVLLEAPKREVSWRPL